MLFPLEVGMLSNPDHQNSDVERGSVTGRKGEHKAALWLVFANEKGICEVIHSSLFVTVLQKQSGAETPGDCPRELRQALIILPTFHNPLDQFPEGPVTDFSWKKETDGGAGRTQ